MGVVGVITPANFHVVIAWAIAPALAAGSPGASQARGLTPADRDAAR